jgi:hypothetical protein
MGLPTMASLRTEMPFVMSSQGKGMEPEEALEFCDSPELVHFWGARSGSGSGVWAGMDAGVVDVNGHVARALAEPPFCECGA